MTQRLTPATAGLLIVPPLLWAGNAVVGRMVHELVPPMTLNLLRWALAFLLLLPLAARVLRANGPVWPYWRRFALLGLLGVGSYNSLQYLALTTSTPINVTLVAAGTPVWMMAIGWLWFGQKLSARQLAGAALSIAGVLFVLCRGDPIRLLAVRLLPGDLFMLLATMVWALYSWLLTRPKVPEEVRADWAGFLIAQMLFGVVWSGLFTTFEWGLTDARITWGWPLAAALLYVAVGPSIIAYRCWDVGVHSVGPTIAAFFSNLTPLFAAVLSAALLGEVPRLYHAIAFVLIVSGIVVSSRRG
ncbi:MAG: DMT family transporter [Burkholderiales bacterium]